MLNSDDFSMPNILVRGSGDVGSAVAHCLFQAGYGVVIHESTQPTTTRRKMAFADAVFDSSAILDGIEAKKVERLSILRDLLGGHEIIPLVTEDLSRALEAFRPQVLVDARMRKHSQPETQIHLAALTIGLGPNFIAGETTHLVIETARGDSLGRVIEHGSASPLQGEPNEIEGHARDRYVYAPVAGKFYTSHQIGDKVQAGQEVARIDSTPLFAPINGTLRGLTHAEVPVLLRAKVIEIDPRIENAQVSGIAERPARIAKGVLEVVRIREMKASR
jgi:xanthine dehydrogenase accessory factor